MCNHPLLQRVADAFAARRRIDIECRQPREQILTADQSASPEACRADRPARLDGDKGDREIGAAQAAGDDAGEEVTAVGVAESAPLLFGDLIGKMGHGAERHNLHYISFPWKIGTESNR